MNIQHLETRNKRRWIEKRKGREKERKIAKEKVKTIIIERKSKGEEAKAHEMTNAQ